MQLLDFSVVVRQFDFMRLLFCSLGFYICVVRFHFSGSSVILIYHSQACKKDVLTAEVMF